MELDLSKVDAVHAREIRELVEEIAKKREGHVSDTQFLGFRLNQGVYGQRELVEVQMVRCKIPGGLVSGQQLVALAGIGRRWTHQIAHLTTRQDIQWHYVKLDDAPKVLAELAEAGITTREACGNTVRNITCDVYAGVQPDEPFDVTPHAQALSAFLLRHPLNRSLARKFKITFSGSPADHGLTAMHDIGFRAETREGVDGFRVVIGGALGSSPQEAALLTEFVPTADVPRLAEAVLTMFERHGDKSNRNRARMKFVLRRLGIEQLREEIMAVFERLGADHRGPEAVERYVTAYGEEQPNPTGWDGAATDPASPVYQTWLRTNVRAQKQAGYSTVVVKLTLGDMHVDTLERFGPLVDAFSGVPVRIMLTQDFLLRWVKNDDLPGLHAALAELDLADAGALGIANVTCCPGAQTCNLGITSSRGLAEDLTKIWTPRNGETSDIDDVRIKISGCPNSCGQHHVAAIGFHGAAKKLNGKLTPHYELFLGGGTGDTTAHFSRGIKKVPAKRATAVVDALIAAYREQRTDGQRFDDWARTLDRPAVADIVNPVIELPDPAEDPAAYRDYFGEETDFSIDGRGQGECAGTVSNAVEDKLALSHGMLEQADADVADGKWRAAYGQIDRAVVAATRALLVTEGMDHDTDAEAVTVFQKLVIDLGVVAEVFEALVNSVGTTPDVVDETLVRTRLDLAHAFWIGCDRAYAFIKKREKLRLKSIAEMDEADAHDTATV